LGFYTRFDSVQPGESVKCAFLHFQYLGGSLADIQTELSAVTINYKLEGVTKNLAGDTLGNCDCHLYKMRPDEDDAEWIAFDESDGSGNYSFKGLLDADAKYFVIAYKDNTPHVMDATDHVLVPVEE